MNHYSATIIVSVFLLCMALFPSCSPPSEPVKLVFAFGSDGEGTVKNLIDEFNLEHRGEIEVTWRQGSRFSSAFYEELRLEFESGNPEFDVIGSDVVWTSAFASNGWVQNLTSHFLANNDPVNYLEMAMESVSYQHKIWGIPWYTDAGMLYYRKDILNDLGISSPPTTWQDLIDAAKKAQAQSKVKYGYVFQGADYEGGVTNMCEYIWNANGSVLIGDLNIGTSFDTPADDMAVVTINSAEARAGLAEVEKIMNAGVVPENISQFREQESSDAFKNGDALFMRSWATAYGEIIGPNSSLSKDQIGLTTIPRSKKVYYPYSCLGGWNLMISAFTNEEKTAAALKFTDFLAAEGSQRFRAKASGTLPTLRSIYEDRSFLKEAPVVDFARRVIPSCKERPKTPRYMEISSLMSGVFAKLIGGELSADEAIEELENGLEQAVGTAAL